MVKETGRKVIVVNRRARHDYAIEDTWEAGIVLQGTEVKSLHCRAGITGRRVRGGPQRRGLARSTSTSRSTTRGPGTNHEPRRPRKLLLHDYEIHRLIGKIKQSGLTLIPMQLYFKDGKAKVEIGLGRGRRATTSGRTSPPGRPNAMPSGQSPPRDDMLTDADLPGLWRELGIPGAIDVHTLPPAPVMRAVWSLLRRGGSQLRGGVAITYRWQDDERSPT